MSHERYQEWLAVYPDLTPREREEVDLHLGTCAACAALLADYRALRRELEERPMPQPSARLGETFAAAVARVQAEDRRAGLWPRLARAGLALGNVAAWAAVIAVTGVLVLAIAITGPELARRAWPAAQPTMTPTPGAGGQWVSGHLTVQGRGTYTYRLLIPPDWAGKYEVAERDNTVSFSYIVPAGVRELLATLTPTPGLAGPNPSEMLFWISLLTDAQWQEAQQQPGAGSVIGTLDGVVIVEAPAIVNSYSAFTDEPWPQVADEFQRMAGQVPAILKSLEVMPGAAEATPTPATEPAVTVARLERMQDLCCPPRFAPDGETYLTISEEGSLLLHSLSGGQAREVSLAASFGPKDGWRVSNATWTWDGGIVITQGPPSEVPHDVYLVDPASGAARRLGETYSPYRLVFDARGRLIVTTPDAFLALDLASGQSTQVPGIWPRLNAEQPEIAFSPDGRYVATLEGQELSIVELATGARTVVTTQIHPRWGAGFAWSEDGRQLAYATGERGAAPELWVVGADGSGARRIATRESERDTGGAFAGVAWLPGTRYVVYEFVPWSNVATLGGEYQAVSAEGGPAKTLFTNGLGLTLSPDGRVISFTRDLEGPDETGNWVAVLEYGEEAEPGPTATPQPVRVPAGTVAVYGVGAPGETLDLYGLAADGSATSLGMQVPWGAVASEDGRWLAHLDAPLPDAHAVVIRNLEDGRRYTVPLGDSCTGPMCVAGLYAFDRDAARLASVEVTLQGWALTVVDLRDGSSRRFELARAQGEPYPILPGAPLGWASTGELLLDTFAPYSEGWSMGVWALTLPASGSPATIDALARRQLVAGGSYLLRPQLSPDGTRLLYLARDRSYTPAGYTLNGGFEDVAVNQLWSLDIASGAASKLVEMTDGGALAGAAAWSPDGREVLFAEGRYDANVLGPMVLKAIDMAGSVHERGTLATPGTLSSLHWCRPKLALATVYGQVNGLYAVDLATGQEALVASDAHVLAIVSARAGEGEAPAPAGSPTPCPSQPIALPEPERFGPVAATAGAIARSSAGGGFDLALETGKVAFVHTLVPWCGQQVREADRGLAWSPDGTRIAFVYSEYGPPQEAESGYLMLADLARGELRPLLEQAGVYGRPAWSPDGRRLAYVQLDGRGVLCVLDVASGAKSEVAHDAVFTSSQAPAWIDDGHVAYARTAGANGTQSELVSVGPDDVAPRLIGQGGQVYALSPDGARVAYSWGNEVRVLEIASGAVESLGASPGVEALQWSPDGRRLLAYAPPAGILLSRDGPLRPLELVARGVPGAQAWSPDGRRFAFVTEGGVEGHTLLAVYDLESAAVTTLGTTVQIPYEVAWSPR